MLKDKIAGVAAFTLALYVGVLYFASCNAVYAQDEAEPTLTVEEPTPTPILIVQHTTLARVSAYCERGLTASGLYTGWGSVAAGQHVPFGTRLYIPNYGYGVVQDRGGAVYGNRLDVWLPSCWAAVQWGVRWLEVTWLS